MSEDDLIRRGDAVKVMADYHWNRYASKDDGGKLSSPAVFTSHTWQDVQDAIRAIPARGVGVKPDMDVIDRSDIDRLILALRRPHGSDIGNKAADLIHSLTEALAEARILALIKEG